MKVAAAIFFSVFALPAFGARPNVVLFLADDLGWSDCGCYGEIWMETPRIDAFAKTGVRFTQFYANSPVCSPTRAAIQSGQFPSRLTLTAHIPGFYRPFEQLTEPPSAQALPDEVVTLGQSLQEAGYHTGYFGKWHLGEEARQHPSQRGYDTAVCTSGSYFAPGFKVSPESGEPVPAGTNVTDYLTDLTLSFLEANKESPFFVTLSHQAVHTPLQARRELISKYEAKAKADPADETNPVYAAMVEQLDESLGRVLAKLDELGLAKNTIVIFTSDNGALRTRYDGLGPVITNNAPFRGEKGTPYEGGIRVPTIIRWPGVSKTGAVCPEPAMSIDFYPTLLEATDSPGPDGQNLDGHSLVGTLRNPLRHLARQSLYWHYPHYHHSRPSTFMRLANFKLIHFYDDGSLELYDLGTDPAETVNLAESRHDLVAEMLEELSIWKEDTGSLTPYWNERFNPRRAKEWWNKFTLTPVDLEAARKKLEEMPADGAE